MEPFLQNIKASIQRLIQRRVWSEPKVDAKVTTLRAGPEFCTHMQDFGFISIPPEEGGKGILIYPSSTRGKGVMIAAASPDHIPEGFEPGDCGLFNNEGVVLKLSGKTVTFVGAEEYLIGEEGSTKKLVTEDVLQTLAVHTHPVAGAAASASVDPEMLVLATDPANTTQKLQGE